MTVSGGAYTAAFDEPNDTMYVKVEALGYKPAVSRAFRPHEGAQRFDFALERAETLSGIVQLPDGKPADGVDVILATGADQVLFQGGHLESRSSAPGPRPVPMVGLRSRCQTARSCSSPSVTPAMSPARQRTLRRRTSSY